MRVKRRAGPHLATWLQFGPSGHRAVEWRCRVAGEAIHLNDQLPAGEARLLASVVVRSKDEARRIGETLESVFQQRDVAPFEVILVDSGSTDDTIAIARRFPVRLFQIPATSFTYGGSLNIGVRAARGAFVVSLSAHSPPVHNRWLAALLCAFADPGVAAVYGRQVPGPEATLMELVGMRLTGVLSDRPRLQRRSANLSNVNAAYRRSLLIELPFDERVRGGEDLAWARAILRRGWSIAYAPEAPVYHSHGEPLLKHLRRTLRDLPTVARATLGFEPVDRQAHRPPAAVPTVEGQPPDAPSASPGVAGPTPEL